jgi:hypothetical protein
MSTFFAELKLLLRVLRAIVGRTPARPLDPHMMAKLADEVAEDTVGFSDMHKGGK